MKKTPRLAELQFLAVLGHPAVHLRQERRDGLRVQTGRQMTGHKQTILHRDQRARHAPEHAGLLHDLAGRPVFAAGLAKNLANFLWWKRHGGGSRSRNGRGRRRGSTHWSRWPGRWRGWHGDRRRNRHRRRRGCDRRGDLNLSRRLPAPAGKYVRDVLGNGVFLLRRGRLPLRQKKRSNDGEGQFQRCVVQRRSRWRRKRGHNPGTNPFPGKGDLSSLQRLDQFIRWQSHRGIGQVTQPLRDRDRPGARQLGQRHNYWFHRHRGCLRLRSRRCDLRRDSGRDGSHGHRGHDTWRPQSCGRGQRLRGPDGRRGRG